MFMATIALDAMGGDFGPEVVIPAAVHVVKKSRDIHIILVGDEPRLRDFAKDHNIDLDEHFEIQHASQVVEMHEDPRHAVRKQRTDLRILGTTHDALPDRHVLRGG